MAATNLNQAQFYYNPFNDQPTLDIGGILHEIGEVIGWGAHGVVLANREHTRVYKIVRGNALQKSHIMSEIVHSELASRLQTGPKFYGWAPLSFPTQDSFVKFVHLPISPAFFAFGEGTSRLPTWMFEGLTKKPDELTVFVSESWDASLLTYLTENEKQWIDLVDPGLVNPNVLESFITRLLELHDHDVIHGDMLPKNILVRYDRLSKRISAMTLSDYGLSGSLDEWFFNTTPEHRAYIMRYFSESSAKWPQHWRVDSYYADMIETFREKGTPDSKALLNWQYWLTNDPFNKDLALLFYLAQAKPSLWSLFSPKTPVTAYKQPNYFNWKYSPKQSDGNQLTTVVVENKWAFEVILNWLDTAKEIKKKIKLASKGKLVDIQFSTPRGIPSSDDVRRMQYSELVPFELSNGPLEIRISANVRKDFLKTVDWEDYLPPPIVYSDESSLSEDE